MAQTEPIRMQIYCRLEVLVHDPEAVSKIAGQQLRDADIDWSRQEEDLEHAVAELESDLTQALAAVIEPDNLVNLVAGIEPRGAQLFTAFGPPDERFRPGFTDAL